MIAVEFFRSVVVAAAAFVVAAAYCFVERCAVLIDIKGEAAFASTVWTGMAGGYSFVFL